MSQYSAKRLIPKIKYNLHGRRNLKNPDGPQGRHNKIRKTVTALFKYERIEMNYHRADESRGYAERLISDAIRYGDCHQPTMEMASYWLLEKQLVHKLFKVLVPRYQNCVTSYTKLWKAPNIYPGHGRPKCVIELRNNIFPRLGEDKSYNKNLIHNVLLDAAKKAYEEKKAKEAQVSTSVEEQQPVSNDALKFDENVEASSGASENINAASDNLNVSENESEQSTETDSLSEVKKEDSETNSSVEENLSNLEITDEEKPKESPVNKVEK